MATHKIPESERYKGPAKWVQYVVARGLVTGLTHLPIRIAYTLGRGAGWLCWKLMPERRAIVRKNLKIITAWMIRQRPNDGANTGSLDAQVQELFQRAGANLFSGFTFNRMSPQQIEQHIELEGLEHLQAALKQSKGVLVLLAHMGPWEALTQLPAFAKRAGVEAPFGAMYRPLNNRYLDDWIKAQRGAKGTRLLSRINGFHQPVDFLRAGGMLGVLSDQKMRQGVTVPFFGQPVSTSPLLGLFHRRSGAPIISVSVATTSPRHWRIMISRVDLPETMDRSDRSQLARRCNEALEEVLSRSPSDGFWFSKRF